MCTKVKPSVVQLSAVKWPWWIAMLEALPQERARLSAACMQQAPGQMVSAHLLSLHHLGSGAARKKSGGLSQEI